MSTFTFIKQTIIVTAASIAVYPLAPIAALLADKDGRLRSGFKWMETHDALGWGAGTYEPAIKKVYDKYGKRVALMFWLWRNKAYTLRNKYRATPDYANMKMVQSGPEIPPHKGFWVWKGSIENPDGQKWFESMHGYTFGKFYLYIRSGWKLKPYFNGDRPTVPGAQGMFNGITFRSDDWDDFPPQD